MVYGHDAAVARWVAERIPHVAGGDFGPCAALGVVNGAGGLVAGAVFHDWQAAAGTLQVSMAAATRVWARPAVLETLFFYAFATVGANKLWTATPHTSAAVVRFNEHIGMTREAVLRHHFGPKRHAVVCSMLRSEWERSRWHLPARAAA